RPPPSPGSAAAASANPARNPSAQARYQGGPVLTLGGDEAKNRNETSSPGPVAAMVPPRRMVVPIPSRAPCAAFYPVFCAASAANTVTGVDTPSCLPPIATESSVAVNLGAPGCTVCVVTAVACTNLPADAACSNTFGLRLSRCAAATPSTRPTAPAATTSTASTAVATRRLLSTAAVAQRAATAHATIAAGARAAGIASRTAAAIQATPTGSARRRSALTRSRDL